MQLSPWDFYITGFMDDEGVRVTNATIERKDREGR